MAKAYRWRTITGYQTTTSLSYGVIPNDTSWRTTEALTGAQTVQYWWRDANVASGGQYTDANSSRAIATVRDSWTASIDDRNNLTIRVTSTLLSLDRDDLRGSNQNTPGRLIQIYREDGALVSSLTDNQLAVAHNISGQVDLGTSTFTLAPGANNTRQSLLIRNETIGYQSWDIIGIGVQFMNPLPKDYRPGMVLDGNGVWQSHNRTAGTAKVLSPSGWNEMRTDDGGVGTGNPPLIRNSTKWVNQRLIGRES